MGLSQGPLLPPGGGPHNNSARLDTATAAPHCPWELPHDRHHRDRTTNRPRAAPVGWSFVYTTKYREISISASRSTGVNVI